MNLVVRLLVSALAVGALLLATGCTTSTADGPTSTTVVPASATPSEVDPSTFLPDSTALPPASPSPNDWSASPFGSLDISPLEAADRAAIEGQWSKFWQVYNDIVRTPSDQRNTALDEVSTEPIKSQILAAAQRFESEGIDYYGSVVQHPYWPIPVDGQTFAVMRDCQDQSNYGSIWVATGEKRSMGVSNNNLQAGFIRGDDGNWRVRTFDHLADEPC